MKTFDGFKTRVAVSMFLALIASTGCNIPQPEIALPPPDAPRFSQAALSGEISTKPTPKKAPEPVVEEAPVALPPPDATPALRFPVSVGYTNGADLRYEEQIAPGVTHAFESRSEGPLTINTVTIDMNRKDLKLDTIKGGKTLSGHHTVSAGVALESTPESRVLAAINGDFFDGNGRMIGMYVDEGTIWRHPWVKWGSTERRSVFAFSDEGDSFIGIPELTMTLRDESGASLTLDKVNMHENSSLATVYTWPVGDTTPAIRENQLQIVLDLPSGRWLPNEPQTVTVERIDEGPTATLDKNTVVIHADKPLPNFIVGGATLTLDASMNDLDWTVTGVMGGLPRLVIDGVADPIKNGEAEAAGRNFVTDNHPRTAVGIKENGEVVFVTVDGRQPNRSIGINLPDLAAYMQSIGCVDALNLDGGGSTTMWAQGGVVNFPSDLGGSRSVGNMLAVRRTAPLEKASSLNVIPNDVVVPVGSWIELEAQATDASGERVSTTFPIVYTPSGSGVRRAADGDNRMEFRSAGTWTINAADPSGKVGGSAKITVEEAESLSFDPHRLLLDVGDETEILLRATRTDGTPFYGNFHVADVTASDFLEYDQTARTVKATGEGVGEIRVRLGTLEAILPVAVNRRDSVVVEPFEAEPSADFLEGVNYNAEETSLALDNEIKEQGSASWKWKYTMASGGTTKIALPLEAELPGDPMEIGLWVYGDGQAQWLRGEISDSADNHYYIDFTTSKRGIDWKNEWRFLRASIEKAKSMTGGAPAPVAPIVVESVYLVQPQEAAKRDGTIYVDGLSAVNFPGM